MRLRCVTFVILVATVFADPYGKGGGRGGGGRGGGGRGRGSSSHSYPSSNGYSGNSAGKAHTYPQSTGLSGSGHSQQTTYQHNQHNQHHQTNTYNYAKTEVHHHYHYNPPQQISYGSTYHPVYRSPPPVYVYQYRDSGSRFDNLLTGLALYNLGRLSARSSHYDVNREYRNNPGEICKLGISKKNGDYEETRIDCRLMTSFIWESGSQSQSTKQQVVTRNTTTTVVETKSHSNGTPLDGSSANDSKTTVIVENKTVVEALEVKGPSVPITPDMKCFMIHISRDSSIRKNNVDCALLQMYAQQSLYRNSKARVLPTFIILLPIFCIKL